ncbi:type VI secretion protein IcmF/TssM N-terminal domain-containing protein [Desulfococcus sp.]|uniref:type VI secretion protein IcmF/TssM N-terminal domain-containing protein n=1 Tax=Desulfococcus sp. TaxID=2025834 RepID=UPI003593240D
MKQILMKMLKITLIVMLVFLLGLLVAGAVFYFKWPWWMALFIVIGLLGAWMGVLFVKKIWLRHREQNFVQQVIQQDQNHLDTLVGRERDQVKEMQDRWKEAIETLRRSHLKKRGNPLYVLPWYVVVGESGTGKTTAIKSARLSSTFAEMTQTSGISAGTRNCDWWFFEEAVIIDTAGRFAVPVDEGRDKEEWQKFLFLLAKFRRREPINGLVVTVAADKLLDGDVEALKADGKTIRRRIDELMRVLGAKFPVYVLVTKCDLIKGMTQFCERIPEKTLDQAMGMVNTELTRDVAAFQARAVEATGQRLRDLRLLLFHAIRSREIDPELLLFPEEFERLKPGLQAFITGAFQENPYQETPVLRGLFFSSGRQEGTPYSHFLKSLGLIGESEVLPGTDKGLFLYDFFSKILPRDRNLFTLTERTIQWSRLTRNLGLTSWIALCVALCGLLSFSFVKNLKTLRDVSNPPALRGEIFMDLEAMNTFRKGILHIEEKNSRWWIPRLGLEESRKAEWRLKARYCDLFRDNFLVNFDREMASRMALFSESTEDVVIGRYAAFLVKRINLLGARIDGKNLAALRRMPQPAYEPVNLMPTPELIPEVRQRFQDLYLYNLIWRDDITRLTGEMTEQQNWLKQILTVKRSSLNWLAGWFNATTDASAITLQDFWGGSLEGTRDPVILPAFTRKGDGEIRGFLGEMEAALPEPLVIAGRKTAFEKWYKNRFVETWQSFLTAFPGGKERLRGQAEWQATAVAMATDQGPYRALHQKMDSELVEFTGREGAPAWLVLAGTYGLVRAAAAASPDQKEGLVTQALEKGGQIFSAIGRGAGKAPDENRIASFNLGVQAYREYQGALEEISAKAASRREAFGMTAQVFTEDPVTGTSPFYKAAGAQNRLRNGLGNPGETAAVFWSLIDGPLEFLWTYYRKEAACHLQTLWEKDVMIDFDPNSEQVAEFVQGPAAPFVDRSPRRGGYFAKSALDHSLDIDTRFFGFLNSRLIQQKKQARTVKENYRVTIKALPVDTNADAQVKPHAVILELQCGEKATSLINLMFPVREVFNWAPGACGDVVLTIEVGTRKLVKRYSGDMPFRSFLLDFSGGDRRFSRKDFPAEADALKRMNISFVKVNYQFSGEDREIRGLTTESRVRAGTPRGIASCWGR